MAQLHFYIPDQVAEKIKAIAKHKHMSVSKYLATLVKREVSEEWPEGYFELFGTWQREPLKRQDQGDYEKRGRFS